jgi:hypothetical protein
MAKPRVSAKEAVRDIRSGMSDAGLMEKYGLSARGLESLFKKLLKAGVVKRADLVRQENLVDSVTLEGLEDDFGRDEIIRQARTELEKLKKRIAAQDSSSALREQEILPSGLSNLMDPFDWFFDRVVAGDRYTKWALQAAEVIEITPMVHIFPDMDQIQKILKGFTPRKECLDAVGICETTGANYCEGWIISSLEQNLPVKHSWNRLHDRYFDVKLELARERMKEPPSPIHILVHELNCAETIEVCNELGDNLRDIWFGELGRAYWMEKIRGT